MAVPTFVDRVVLQVSAGDGGHGCASVHREKFKPLGGPDGGNGGQGGDVILRVDPQVSTLVDYYHHRHQRAGSGRPGEGAHRNGAAGNTLILGVPDGTVVSSEDGQVLSDLVGAGTELGIGAGGRGGLGNAALSSARRRAPGFALKGEPGAEGTIVLELKVVADVGLVGFPSAGKSSLVAALSRARPKIADYPFTTLVPNVGMVTAGETTFAVADVPGLIEGASDGRGLGHDFLRHVERCAALCHVIDCATIEPDRDPLSDLDVIEAELATYGGLDGRPRVVALNKVDVPDGREMAEMLRPDIERRGLTCHLISAATHEGLRELSFTLAGLVQATRAAAPDVEPTRIVLRPSGGSGDDVMVERAGDTWRVRGDKPTRWIRQTDFGNDEAVGYLADRLARLGVEDRLLKLGAQPGDPVAIGPDDDAVVFDFEPQVDAGGQNLGPRGYDLRLEDPHGRRRRRRDEDADSGPDELSDEPDEPDESDG